VKFWEENAHNMPERVTACNCGSGLESWWEYDAQNIPLCRVCDECRKEKLSHYRPEILTGYTQADVDEPIDEDL
jgi:hypothetical protein